MKIQLRQMQRNFIKVYFYRQNPHKRVYTIDRFHREDYYPYQEQRDLERYKFYMNSFAWDMVNEVLCMTMYNSLVEIVI